MTTINGITIPDAGETVEQIPDTIGGHLYTVTTTVTVEMSRLDEVQARATSLQNEIEEKTAILESLQSNIALFPVMEMKANVVSTASSTPAKLQ